VGHTGIDIAFRVTFTIAETVVEWRHPGHRNRNGVYGMSTREVLDLVKRWETAELNEDAAALDGLLAGDFCGIGPLGFVLSRQQWLGRYHGGLRNAAFAAQDPQVRIYGETAVVIAVQKQETTFQEHDSSGEFRLGMVAVKQDGDWAIANIQLSGPLGAPPSAPPDFKRD
jgi:uncharacterized protein DUF4440